MSRARLLLVEDEPDLLEVYRLILQQAGHEVVATDNLETAKTALSEDKPVDLVISDIWLAGHEATGLVEICGPNGSAVPVIAISGGNSGTSLETTLLRAEMRGVARFLFKPVSREELLQAVDDLLAAR